MALIHLFHLQSGNMKYCIVASTNTCYYSENQVFGGVTIRVLCIYVVKGGATNRDMSLTETC